MYKPIDRNFKEKIQYSDVINTQLEDNRSRSDWAYIIDIGSDN